MEVKEQIKENNNNTRSRTRTMKRILELEKKHEKVGEIPA